MSAGHPEVRSSKSGRTCLSLSDKSDLTSDFGLLAGLLQFIVVAILALCPLVSRAGISATAFEAANKLYEEGKFSDAATAYAKLLQGGQTSAALYFNLGNAFFKSGQIGRAIAAYRLAGQLTPRDPDVRANLQFARNQTQGPAVVPNRWQRWLGRLTLNEWTVLAACAVWLWLVVLAVLQWRPSLRPASEELCDRAGPRRAGAVRRNGGGLVPGALLASGHCHRQGGRRA